MIPELSDIVSRVLALESRRNKQEEVKIPHVPGFHFFDEQIELASGSITANLDWTDSGASAHIPLGAKFAIVYAGLRDTTNGTGYCQMYHRGDGKYLTLSTIYEGSSNAQEVNYNQCIVPISQGTFDYSITVAGGATSLYYELFLQGYIQ